MVGLKRLIDYDVRLRFFFFFFNWGRLLLEVKKDILFHAALTTEQMAFPDRHRIWLRVMGSSERFYR